MAIRFRRTARGVAARGLLLLAALALGTPLAGARPEPDVSAGLPGKIVDLPAGRGEGELLRLDARLVPALLALRAEESATVADWPVAPGVRRAVNLTRHEIWAEDAKVYRVDAGGRTEIPRSPLVFFWGERHGGSRSPGRRRGRPVDAGAHGARARAGRPARDRARSGGRGGPAPPRAAGPTGLREREMRPGGLRRDGFAAVLGRGTRRPGPDGGRPRLALQGGPRDRHGHGVPRVVLEQHDGDDELHRDARREHQRDVRAGPEPAARDRDDDPADGLGPVDRDGLAGERIAPEPVPGLLEHELPEIRHAALLRGALFREEPGRQHLGRRVHRGLGLRHLERLQLQRDLRQRKLALGRHAHRGPRDRPQHGLAAHALLRGSGARPLLRGRGLLLGRDVLPGRPDDQRRRERDGHDHELLPPLRHRRLQLVARLSPLTVSRYVGPALDAGATSACIALVVPPPPPPPPVSAATTFHTLTPCRVLDTRTAAGPLGGPAMGALALPVVRRRGSLRRSRPARGGLRERHGREPRGDRQRRRVPERAGGAARELDASASAPGGRARTTRSSTSPRTAASSSRTMPRERSTSSSTSTATYK